MPLAHHDEELLRGLISKVLPVLKDSVNPGLFKIATFFFFSPFFLLFLFFFANQ